jgi:hypothetical protein
MKRAPLLQVLPVTIAMALLAAACSSGSGGGGDGGSGGSDPIGACTLIGCDDGLTIKFSLDEPGTYTFELVADGESITCSAALPLPPCSSGGASNCSANGVFVGESGCALDPSAQSLEDLAFMGTTPTSVEITVLRDGVEITRQTFTPAYKTVTPNGPGCDPTCTLGEVSLAAP